MPSPSILNIKYQLTLCNLPIPIRFNLQHLLMYQQLGEQIYFDQACFQSAPGKKYRGNCP